MNTKTTLRTATALLVSSLLGITAVQAQTPALYSHGDPTAEEQYLLEKLNHARMDPVGEGQRLAAWLRLSANKELVTYYAISPDQVSLDVAQFAPVPPVALDASLLAAARAHALDLARNGTEGPSGDAHAGWDGSIPSNRVRSHGYRGVFGGENVDPGSDTLEMSHAGYLVDWGVPDLGHRRQVLSDRGINAVGIGLAENLSNSTYPLVQTEDYGLPGLRLSGTRQVVTDAAAFLLGAVYADANANGQYDVGEGIAGVSVTMDGGAYYTVTSASGGYALPLTRADGSFVDGAVEVHALGLPDGTTRDTTVQITTASGQNGTYRANVKWDVVTTGKTGGGTTTAGPTATLSGGGTVSRSGRKALKLVVQRPAGADTSESMDVALATKGTAVAGVDYKALPGTVTIPAGAESAKFRVKPLAGDGSRGVAKLTIKVKKAKGEGSKAVVNIMP